MVPDGFTPYSSKFLILILSISLSNGHALTLKILVLH